MPAPLNLIGQKFGNLKVIEKLPSRNGKVYWRCKCDICNSEYEIQTNHLRDGSYKKCCEEKQTIVSGGGEKRICPICGKEFITIAYGANRKFCFDCSPYYSHGDNYNRAKTITSIRRAIKKRLVEYKGGKCEICGYNKCIQALQFHHTDSTKKDFTISSSLNLSNFNIQEYFNEVDKCQLLCANCHTEKHAKEWI